MCYSNSPTPFAFKKFLDGCICPITPHRPLTLSPFHPLRQLTLFIHRSRDMYIHIHFPLSKAMFNICFHLSGQFHICTLSQLRHCSMYSIIQNFEQGFPFLCSPIRSNMASKIRGWCQSCRILDSKQNSNHKILSSNSLGQCAMQAPMLVLYI